MPALSETIERCHCLYPDCKHSWMPRSFNKPVVCPKCKRYNWDKGVRNVRAKSALSKIKKLLNKEKSNG